MGNRNTVRLRLVTLAAVASVAAVVGLGTGCGSDDSTDGLTCESTKSYFAKEVWGIVSTRCIGCHSADGIARDTEYVLKSSAEAGFLDHNLNAIATVASQQQDGQSVWLLKPTATVAHKGGTVVARGSDDYKAMLGLVVRLGKQDTCPDAKASVFEGVEIADSELTLRKFSLLVAGRLPTSEELELVRTKGDRALDPAMDRMMAEPAFLDFVKTTYGDFMQTDFYLNNNAPARVSGAYANARWHETASQDVVQQYGLASAGELSRLVGTSIAREPLELISWVVKNNLPFTEILTADYTMFTPLSARSYGAEMIEDFSDANDPLEFKPGRLPSYPLNGTNYDFPHAGVLTSPMFLRRWPTTETNRNRARSRVTMLFFLGTNILLTASRPLAQSKVVAINPQRDDPACTVCHVTLDPIAGAYQAFDDDGVWTPEPEWYTENWPAGYGSLKMPLEEAPYGLQWLSRQMVADDRFALGVVSNMYKGLIGRAPLAVPADTSDPLYGAQFDGYLAQAELFGEVARKFKDSKFDLKVVVRELAKSPYFRGINSSAGSPAELAARGDVGLGHLLTPEQLHRKIIAVTGLPWGERPSRPHLNFEPRDRSDAGDFQIYYGGVDFESASTRIAEPNGLMASVAERMAMDMACLAVPMDLTRPVAERQILPAVELEGAVLDPVDLVPEQAGLAVAQAQEGIRQTIVRLHERFLGEKLELSDPEVERTYQLFLETWREGQAQLESGAASDDLQWACRATEDYWSGRSLPADLHVVTDDKFTIRAWMAVVTYLMSDYRFLFE